MSRKQPEPPPTPAELWENAQKDVDACISFLHLSFNSLATLADTDAAELDLDTARDLYNATIKTLITISDYLKNEREANK